MGPVSVSFVLRSSVGICHPPRCGRLNVSVPLVLLGISPLPLGWDGVGTGSVVQTPLSLPFFPLVVTVSTWLLPGWSPPSVIDWGAFEYTTRGDYDWSTPLTFNQSRYIYPSDCLPLDLFARDAGSYATPPLSENRKPVIHFTSYLSLHWDARCVIDDTG